MSIPAPAPNELHEADLALRDRVLAGDRAAAEDLFARHVDSLYEYVSWRVGNDRGTAESIVQDALLVGFERLVDFAGRSSLHTWLCGIAKHKILNWRKKKRAVPMQDLLAQLDPEIDAILLGIETEDIPERVLMRRETRDLVGATLSSLPPEYREALLRKYVEDEPVAAIARSLGKSDKAAESTLTRARAAFTRVFELLVRRRGEEA